VTERVKPDPAKSQFQTCRNQVVVAHRIGMTRHPEWELQANFWLPYANYLKRQEIVSL
jgi:hypothetical protein